MADRSLEGASSMSTYWRLVQFARPLRRYIPQYLFFSVAGIIFGVANFTLLIPLLNLIFDTVPVAEALHPGPFRFNEEYLKGLFLYYFYGVMADGGKMAALRFVCGTVLISVLLSNTFRYLSQRLLNGLRTMVVLRLRQALFSQLSSLHVHFYHKERTGNLISVVSNDVTEVEHSIVSTFQVVLREPLVLVGYLLLLLRISVDLTVFGLILLPVTGVVIGSITRRLRREAGVGQELLGRLISSTQEAISGSRIIKAFNARAVVRARFDRENSEYRQVLKSIFHRKELASPASEVMGIAAVLGIILYGGSMVIRGDGGLSASEFITYIILFSQLLPPAKAMTAAFTNIQRGLAAADRIFDLLDRTDEVQENKSANARSIHTLNSEIEWVRVGFRYGEEWVLRDINLRLEKGKTVALVGHSGSGKSTLADLIPRFMDPQEGSIRVDGVDIRDLSLLEWRALLGIVGQDSLLFHDSVLANIAFGDEKPDRARAEEAARVAYAHEFIEVLPQGYDTPVGDRGHLLSGGQRQRLCIARAIYRNPPILILDEATSALDTESERWVQAALARIMVDRTSLVIAHRLSTVQHADRIVVLDRGRIVAQGTHEELMAGSARYRRFIDGQSDDLLDG